MNKELKTYDYTVSWKEIDCDKCNGTGKQKLLEEVEFSDEDRIHQKEQVEIENPEFDCEFCGGDKKLVVPDEIVKFTFKKFNLRLRQESVKWRNKVIKNTIKANESVSKSKLSSEKESDDYKFFETQEKVNATLEMDEFLSDEQNLRDLFVTCLDGDIYKIDYSGETDESYTELKELGAKVLNDFFTMSSGKENRKLAGAKQ